MDLPKNITQIGESDQRCKVYVEDYVISYIKQMNRQAENHNVAVALYGIRKEENQVSYIFFYGAGKVNSVQKEVRHLSQAQSQEIEKLRKRYFPEYEFLGYRMLNGEMVEGFHICEQGNCRYVNGYACFYEKNDTMLAYMLDSRKEEVPPENVDQEKYERVRQRQEERRAQYRGSRENDQRNLQESFSEGRENEEEHTETEYFAGKVNASYGHAAKRTARTVQAGRGITQFRRTKNPRNSLKIMRAATVGMFLLLCIIGITALTDSYNMEGIQTAARRLISEFTEQKIPDSQQEQETTGQNSTLVAEDKLTEAIREENNAKQETDTVQETEETTGAQPQTEPDQSSENPPAPTEQQPTESDQPQQQPPQETVQQTTAPVTYTIQKGDTLTAISLKTYGTDAKVKDICELNNIPNPNSIRYGQKIILP